VLTNPTITRVKTILSGSYRGQYSEEAMQGIITACLNLDDEAFETAATRHLSDTGLDRDGQPVGNWFPKPAQLLRHAEQLEQERRRAAQAAFRAVLDEDADRTAAMPETTPVGLDGGEEYGIPPVVQSRPADCRHCNDTGKARFYAACDDPRRVWLAPEYLELPEAVRDRVTCLTALCDCRLGMARPERQWLTTVRYRGQDREIPVWARLEVVRQLAARRRSSEEQAVGAA
jgi:hypothetical protein